jgi:hypothetical protein
MQILLVIVKFANVSASELYDNNCLYLIADAVGNAWSLDAATNMLTVRKPKLQTNQKLDASKLQRLTECVFHLES